LSLRGLSQRQPGRFIAISKQSQNDQEYDGVLEGQWWITNVLHHFSPKDRSYSNNISAVKTHVYKTDKLADEDDVMIVS
jgi:hypothetical protein